MILSLSAIRYYFAYKFNVFCFIVQIFVQKPCLILRFEAFSPFCQHDYLIYKVCCPFWLNPKRLSYCLTSTTAFSTLWSV